MDKGTCSLNGCVRPVRTLGMCAVCYNRTRITPEFPIALSDEQRFLLKVVVNPQSRCWEWTAWRDQEGYGGFAGRRAHRWAWEHWHGPIPAGLVVCHACDNPSCVFPDHLFVGTQRANILDKHTKGRANTAKGRQYARTVLTEEQVRKIRAMYVPGVFGKNRIARELGLGVSAVGHVLDRSSWDHVA